MSGSPRSSTTTSGCSVAAASSADRPSAAVTTSQPCARRLMASARASAGSSSTTSTFIRRLPARGHRHDHGQPAAGGVLGGERCADRLGEAAGDGEPEAEPTGRGVVEALERLEHPLPLLGGTPGPRSTTMISTVSGRTWASTRTGVPDETRTALTTRLATTRSSSPTSVDTSGTDSSISSETASGGWPAVGQRQHLLERSRPQLRLSSPACTRDRSSRLSISRSSCWVESSSAATSSLRSPGLELVARDQPVDGRAHRRQRRPQVVGDRPQQCCRGRLRRLQRGRPVLALAQPSVLQHQRGLHGERLEHPLVAATQRRAAQREDVLVVDLDPGVAVLGRAWRTRRRWRRAPASRSALARAARRRPGRTSPVAAPRPHRRCPGR